MFYNASICSDGYCTLAYNVHACIHGAHVRERTLEGVNGIIQRTTRTIIIRPEGNMRSFISCLKVWMDKTGRCKPTSPQYTDSVTLGYITLSQHNINCELILYIEYLWNTLNSITCQTQLYVWVTFGYYVSLVLKTNVVYMNLFG